MSYLADNLKVLLWKNKGELSQKTYSEYIDFVATQCSMDSDHFRSILRDQSDATDREEAALRKFFSDYSDTLSAMRYTNLFADLVVESGDEILEKNLMYLLKSIGHGENQEFVEEIGVNPSTLTRWKQGKTKPDKYAQTQIARYFGFRDANDLRGKFLFLDLDPVSTQQKKQDLKSRIDAMGKEEFESLYEALKALKKVL